MEHYASKEKTLAALKALGFIALPEEPEDHRVFLDSPKQDAYHLPVVQVSIYQCRNGYWCVDADGGFKAPCIWDGPKADWDKSDTLSDFVAWLNANHPGWR
jgi:hypothetical protein